MLPKELVILGGGWSVLNGIEKGLFDKLKNMFCIGLNYSYNWVETTALCGTDEDMYNADHEKIQARPELWIGKENMTLKKRGDNHVFFKDSYTYDRELDKGVYTPTLTGLFCLSLMIRAMNEGTIYLLGYDYGPKLNEAGEIICEDRAPRFPLTHWYQGKLNHRGIGKINWYTATVSDPLSGGVRISHAEKEFRPYAPESKVKIFNVSPQSNIPTFEKIGYEEFFRKTETAAHNQETLRADLKAHLIALKKEKKI